MSVVALCSAQIAAQTRDIFPIIMENCTVYHYKTRLEYFLFSYSIFVLDICRNLGKFVQTNKIGL